MGAGTTEALVAAGDHNGRGQLLCPKEAAVYLRIVTAKTLANWRCYGIGPKYVKTGRGSAARVYYWTSDLDEWLADPLVGI